MEVLNKAKFFPQDDYRLIFFYINETTIIKVEEFEFLKKFNKIFFKKKKKIQMNCFIKNKFFF